MTNKQIGVGVGVNFKKVKKTSKWWIFN